MIMLPSSDDIRPSRHRIAEAGSSMVEYVGLGALGTMLVSGIAAAVDSAAGDRLGAAILRQLLSAISGEG